MTRREVITGLLAAAAAAPSLRAQQQLDFLHDLGDFQDMRQMLPEYLKKRAFALLDERQRTVDKITTQAQVDERRAYVRRVMTEAVGGFPEKTPLNPKVVGTLDYPEYKIEKVIFESRPNFFVTANLYLPKTGQGPYPAVLFPLGHEEGAKAHYYWQYMLITLARRGYVALAWDPIGQGERAQMWDEDFANLKLVHSTTEHTVLGTQCLLIGDNVAQYTIWDGRRALDYLLSRPEVDTTRVACTGNSGGGTHTAYISALEDRIQVAMPSCFITSWRNLLDTIGPQDAEQVLMPFLAAGLDHPDFIYAFAPKPYLMLSAIRDFFPIMGARASFAEATRLYERLGMSGEMAMSEVDNGHGYHKGNREAAYNWLSKHFKGAEDHTPEPDMEIAAYEDLRCTATGQVATSLRGENVWAITKKRFAAIDPKVPAIRGAADLAGYRREIADRARTASRIEYEKKSVEARTYGIIDRGEYRIEKIAYTSEPGIVIPSLLFVPAGGGTKPAIVYLHGRGKMFDARPGGDIEWFVKQGNIVMAIDVRGVGEGNRFEGPNGDDFQVYFDDYESAATAFLMGTSLVGMRAADILRAVDVLSARSDVDGKKIMGFSKGKTGVPLLYAAALDERLSQLAFESMLVSYRAVIEHRIHRGVYESIIPGVLKSFDLPDLVSALAPRRVWLVNSTDPLGERMWLEDAEKAYAGCSAVFSVAGGSLKVVRRGNEQGPSVYREWLG